MRSPCNLIQESSELTPTKNPWKAWEIAAQMSRKALSEATRIPKVIFAANAYTEGKGRFRCKLQPYRTLGHAAWLQAALGLPPCFPGLSGHIQWHVCSMFPRTASVSLLAPGSGPARHSIKVKKCMGTEATENSAGKNTGKILNLSCWDADNFLH